MPDILVLSFVIIILVVSFLAYFLASFKFKENSPLWLQNIPKFIPVTLGTLLIAYFAYNKVDVFLRESTLFQLSDRCLTGEIKINEIYNSIYPVFINQGGNALAYEVLVRGYIDSKDKPNSNAGKHLLRIYDNLQYFDDYFKESTFGVSRSRNKGQWEFDTLPTSSFDGVGTEEWNEFDVINVIAQVNHPTFWTTRAKCAKLLQNEDYLVRKKNFNAANLERFKAYNWEVMFENLINNIKVDSSLMVRKISADTYKFWVCKGETEGKKVFQEDCGNFVKDNIYYFDKIVEHWKKYKTAILEDFRKRIGL